MQHGLDDLFGAAGPTGPAGVAWVVRAADRRDVGDRVCPVALPRLELVAIAEFVDVRATVEDHGLAGPALREGLAHHRHERGDAGSGRDEQVRSSVVGFEEELALRPDHPHPVPDRQPPQQRREPDDRHQAHVHLVAGVAGLARRRGDRIRPLPQLAVGEDTGGHVLARLERDHVGVVLDPEVGEVVGVIDALDERGVVLRGVRFDDAVVVGESHADRSPSGPGSIPPDGTRPACLDGIRRRTAAGLADSRPSGSADSGGHSARAAERHGAFEDGDGRAGDGADMQVGLGLVPRVA